MAARLPRCVACDSLLEDRRAAFEEAAARAVPPNATEVHRARATSDALDAVGAWRECCRDHLERLMDGEAPQMTCWWRAYMAHRDREVIQGVSAGAPPAATAPASLSYRCRRCFLPVAPAPGQNFAVCPRCAFDGLAKRPRGPPLEQPRWL